MTSRSRTLHVAEIKALGPPEIARRYSVLPMRAVQDQELSRTSLRVLGVLCMHSNGKGIAWPSRLTIARHIGMSPWTVSNHFKRLVEKGYIRQLDYKKYPRDVKPRGRGLTIRWQILYDGPKTPVPTREDLYSPLPKLKLEEEPLEQVISEYNGQGVRGIEAKSLAGSFCAGVAAAGGGHRILEQQLDGAKALLAAGVTADQVRAVAEKMSRERLAAGRQPPLNIKQLSSRLGVE